MFYKKNIFPFVILFIVMGIILPFIFLKEVYPFHRFGMFAEPMKHQTQYEKFYVFYKIDTSKNEFMELKPQNIPLNANAFEMQLRKYHYQKNHAAFITVFNEIMINKLNLNEENKENQKINWKWYHVIQNSRNKLDSICVFSN